MGEHESQVAVADQSPTREAPGPAGTDHVLARGSLGEVAALIDERPAQRDAIIRALHAQRGNAFVQQVLASVGAVAKAEVAAVEDDATGLPGPIGTRFQGDGKLGSVESGTAELKLGDSGRAVRKLQVALAELNFRPLEITGVFDAATEASVQAYQVARKLARHDGVMDSATFKTLEMEFTPAHYASMAKHAPPGMANTPKRQTPDPKSPMLNETHALSADEAAEANEIISPAKSGPAIGKFHESIGDGMENMYGPKMLKILQAHIDSSYADAKSTQKDHDKGNTYGMDHLVRLGNAAKQQVDGVFGGWATGAELKADVNMRDRYTVDRDAQSKMDPAKKLSSARSRARYLLNNNKKIPALDKAHSADQTRDVEAGIIDSVLDILARDNTEKLLLITATMPAATDRSGDIKIDRTKSGDERDQLWKKFGTMIHEYLHSLVHPNWHKHRDDKGKTDPQGGNVLGEGVTEFLTRAVVSQLNLADPKLHQAVEGGLHGDEPADYEPDLNRSQKYAEPYTRALGLVGVVGAHNVYAAYFLGHMKLIGA